MENPCPEAPKSTQNRLQNHPKSQKSEHLMFSYVKRMALHENSPFRTFGAFQHVSPFQCFCLFPLFFVYNLVFPCSIVVSYSAFTIFTGTHTIFICMEISITVTIMVTIFALTHFFCQSKSQLTNLFHNFLIIFFSYSNINERIFFSPM